MNSKKRIQLISDILDRYDDGVFLDWWENIDPIDRWEDKCLNVIEKVIHDKKFKL